jgi:hypothetical protein
MFVFHLRKTITLQIIMKNVTKYKIQKNNKLKDCKRNTHLTMEFKSLENNDLGIFHTNYLHT